MRFSFSVIKDYETGIGTEVSGNDSVLFGIPDSDIEKRRRMVNNWKKKHEESVYLNEACWCTVYPGNAGKLNSYSVQFNL